MRSTRTPVRPRRRPPVAGIRRPVRPDPAETEIPQEEPAGDDDSGDDDSGGDDSGGDHSGGDHSGGDHSGGDHSAQVAGGRRAWLPAALLLVAALLVTGGVWALARAEAARTEANTALVDTGGTAEATRQVREGLERVFSYRHDNTAATEEAARVVLTGAAREQYERLFRQVREQAPAQRLTLATRVVGSGVVSLRGDQAVLLVFLDQSAVRGDNGEATTAGAQLSVTAVLTDGRWLISELVPR